MYAKYFKIKANVCTTFKGHACNHQETFCILTNFAKLEDNASWRTAKPTLFACILLGEDSDIYLPKCRFVLSSNPKVIVNFFLLQVELKSTQRLGR